MPPVSRADRDAFISKLPLVDVIARRRSQFPVRYFPLHTPLTSTFSSTMHALLFCMSIDALLAMMEDPRLATAVCDSAGAFTSMSRDNYIDRESESFASWRATLQHPSSSLTARDRGVCVLTRRIIGAEPVPIVMEGTKGRDVALQLFFGRRFVSWLREIFRDEDGGAGKERAWNVLTLSPGVRAHFSSGRLALRPWLITGRPYRVHCTAHWMTPRGPIDASRHSFHRPDMATIEAMLPREGEAWQGENETDKEDWYREVDDPEWERGPQNTTGIYEQHRFRFMLPTYEDARRMFAVLTLRWTAAVVSCMAGVRPADNDEHCKYNDNGPATGLFRYVEPWRRYMDENPYRHWPPANDVDHDVPLQSVETESAGGEVE
ncbi:hypothetical protein IF1G_09765 [Cordyceps javanica]|uniref:Uncharacterized protein n=1 Tax=Cordyceps javanica TaxID=43265 RepID=A0A545UQH4_9HYPO|nr:hypothetical protein IF1G_09765 [Cordyceps javanica]